MTLFPVPKGPATKRHKRHKTFCEICAFLWPVSVLPTKKRSLVGHSCVRIDYMHDSICEVIGSTPIIRLRRIPQNNWAEILVKLESLNPGGSVKDRIGLSMIEAAERQGRLKPGGTIIEATSGNTGIGLAMVCAAKGYKAILTMPDDVNIERVALLRAYGARVYLTPRLEFMPGAT